MLPLTADEFMAMKKKHAQAGYTQLKSSMFYLLEKLRGIHAGETVCLIGAGTSLRELPDSFRFPPNSAPHGIHTIALNASVIAPQFYDAHEGVRAFHPDHSWTYSLFIDSAIIKPHLFPEVFYYDVTMQNRDHFRVFAKGMQFSARYFKDPSIMAKCVELPISSGLGGVLGAALLLSEILGFKRIILFGCDLCRRNEHRYWWEFYPEITDMRPAGVRIRTDMIHENYRPVNLAKVSKAVCRSNGMPTEGIAYRLISRKGMEKLIFPTTAPNGETIYTDRAYARQYHQIMNRIRNMQERGYEILKFSDIGVVDIHHVTLLQLNQLVGNTKENGNGEVESTEATEAK